jgi:two-component system sensor histidine kinase VicK
MQDDIALQEEIKRLQQNERELQFQLDSLPRKLEESKAMLSMVTESTRMGTWEYMPVNGDLTWSDECRKIFAISPSTPITFDLYIKHIHEQNRDFVLLQIQNAMDPAIRAPYDISIRIVRTDLQERWVRAQGKVYFAGEQAEKFIGTILDITESKLAEEKSARLVAIIESSDDAIISKTLDGIITTWNESATRTLGYSAEEMIGQSVMKLIPANRAQEEPHILSRLRNGERVEHFETKRLMKNGALLDVSLTISPIKDNYGNIIGLSKILRDITEKKQEETRKNDFIAMVSHELKTPLTSMKAFVQLLLSRANKDGDAFRINALTRANAQVKKMTVMIQDFLSLARLEDGKISLNKELFALHPVMKDIAEDAQYISTSHQVILKDCEDITLYADQDKIGQVLMNLLSNAIKYSPKGGNIIIGCEKQADKVKIFVSDEGVGVRKEDQKRLFERFYRSRNESVKNVSGFGIGLYLVSEILRYHDTKIEVESEEGKGSTFYFFMDAQVG